MDNEQAKAAIELAVVMGRRTRTLSAYQIAQAICELQKIAAQLHKRYENACNYNWANEPPYLKTTEKLEAKSAEIGKSINANVKTQRDPRGWPLIITVKKNKEVYETRLG